MDYDPPRDKDAEQSAGRLALALAQATLSMLTATRTLQPEVVRAVADGMAGVGLLELTKEEASLLSKIIHTVLEE